MIVVIVLALIKGVQTFDEVFVLTGGGPGTATLMVVQYIYETAFSNQVQNFGLAAAASVVLGVVLFVLTLAATRRRAAQGGLRWQPCALQACFASVATAGRPLHWTDVAAYAYLALGVVLMFGPVLWLVLSSFKTQSALAGISAVAAADVAQVEVTVPG